MPHKYAPEAAPPPNHLVHYLTVTVVAEMYGVSTKTVRNWIADGVLDAVKLGEPPRDRARDNRPVRIPADALADLTHPVIGGRA